MDADKFWSKVNKQQDGCWIWTGAKTYEDYGVVAVKTGYRKYKIVCVHRWTWEQLYGPIETGLHLDHLCKVRLCVNPDHLEPVTPKENVRRSNRVSQRPGFCKHDHDLAREGYALKRGGVRCRACDRERGKLRRALKKAASQC